MCLPSLHRVPGPDTTEDGMSLVMGARRCQPITKDSPGDFSPGLSAPYRLSFTATARRGERKDAEVRPRERTSFCADSATCFGAYQSLAWLSHVHPMSRSTSRNGKVLPVIAIISRPPFSAHRAVQDFIHPSSRKEKPSPPARIMWSWTLISNNDAACSSLRVISLSSFDAQGLPDV